MSKEIEKKLSAVEKKITAERENLSATRHKYNTAISDLEKKIRISEDTMKDAAVIDDSKGYAVARIQKSEAEAELEMFRSNLDRITNEGIISPEAYSQLVNEIKEADKASLQKIDDLIYEIDRKVTSMVKEYDEYASRIDGLFSALTEIKPDMRKESVSIGDPTISLVRHFISRIKIYNDYKRKI